MLGLQFDTETSWADIAKVNLEQILTDHAFLEQKAASNAVSIIINYSEETALVKEMSNIAIEEMQHFKMVHFFNSNIAHLFNKGCFLRIVNNNRNGI